MPDPTPPETFTSLPGTSVIEEATREFEDPETFTSLPGEPLAGGRRTFSSLPGEAVPAPAPPREYRVRISNAGRFLGKAIEFFTGDREPFQIPGIDVTEIEIQSRSTDGEWVTRSKVPLETVDPTSTHPGETLRESSARAQRQFEDRKMLTPAVNVEGVDPRLFTGSALPEIEAAFIQTKIEDTFRDNRELLEEILEESTTLMAERDITGVYDLEYLDAARNVQLVKRAQDAPGVGAPLGIVESFLVKNNLGQPVWFQKVSDTFTIGLNSLFSSLEFQAATERLDKGEGSKADADLVLQAWAGMDEQARRGTKWYADIAQGIAELPKYMLQFYLGTKIFGKLSKRAGAGALRLVKVGGASRVTQVVVGEVAKSVTLGAGITVTTMLPEVLSKTVQAKLATGVSIGKDGKLSLDVPEGSTAGNLTKATLRVFAEATGESTAKLLTFGFGRTLGKVPVFKIVNGHIARAVAKLKPSARVQRMLKAGGIASLPGEFGEERTTALIKAVLGVAEKEDKTLIENIDEALFPEWGDLVRELGVLSVFPTVRGFSAIFQGKDANARAAALELLEELKEMGSTDEVGAVEEILTTLREDALTSVDEEALAEEVAKAREEREADATEAFQAEAEVEVEEPVTIVKPEDVPTEEITDGIQEREVVVPGEARAREGEVAEEEDLPEAVEGLPGEEAPSVQEAVVLEPTPQQAALSTEAEATQRFVQGKPSRADFAAANAVDSFAQAQAFQAAEEGSPEQQAAEEQLLLALSPLIHRQARRIASEFGLDRNELVADAQKFVGTILRGRAKGEVEGERALGSIVGKLLNPEAPEGTNLVRLATPHLQGVMRRGVGKTRTERVRDAEGKLTGGTRTLRDTSPVQEVVEEAAGTQADALGTAVSREPSPEEAFDAGTAYAKIRDKVLGIVEGGGEDVAGEIAAALQEAGLTLAEFDERLKENDARFQRAGDGPVSGYLTTWLGTHGANAAEAPSSGAAVELTKATTAWGLNLRWYDPTGKINDAYYFPNTNELLLPTDQVDNHLFWTFMHEFWHDVQTRHEGLTRDLKAFAETQPRLMQIAREDYARRTGVDPREVTDDEVEANLIDVLSTQQAFLDGLQKGAPGLWQRLKDLVRRLFNSIPGLASFEPRELSRLASQLGQLFGTAFETAIRRDLTAAIRNGEVQRVAKGEVRRSPVREEVRYVTIRGKPIEVVSNPTSSTLRQMLKEAVTDSETTLRGVLTPTGTVYVWDAFNAMHDEMEIAMGEPGVGLRIDAHSVGVSPQTPVSLRNPALQRTFPGFTLYLDFLEGEPDIVGTLEPLRSPSRKLLLTPQIAKLLRALTSAKKGKNESRQAELRAELDALGATSDQRPGLYKQLFGRAKAPVEEGKVVAAVERVSTDPPPGLSRKHRVDAVIQRIEELGPLAPKLVEDVMRQHIMTDANGQKRIRDPEQANMDLLSVKRYITHESNATEGMSEGLRAAHQKELDRSRDRLKKVYKSAPYILASRNAFAHWERYTGLPFVEVFLELAQARNDVDFEKSVVAAELRTIAKKHGRKYTFLVRDKGLTARLVDMLEGKEVPDVTPLETELHAYFRKALDDLKLDTRLARTLTYLDVGLKIPGAPKEDLDAAERMSVASENREDLVKKLREFLADKKWGTVDKNYAPREVLLGTRIPTYNWEAGITNVPVTGSLRARTKIKDAVVDPALSPLLRSMPERLFAIKKGLTAAIRIRPALRALSVLTNTMKAQLATKMTASTSGHVSSQTTRLENNIQAFSQEIIGQVHLRNPVARFASRAVGQFFSVRFIAPDGFVMNILQTFVNLDANRLLSPRNYRKVKGMDAYFERNVDEAKTLRVEAMEGREARGIRFRGQDIRGVTPATRAVSQLALQASRTFEIGDRVGRRAAYTVRVNRVLRAFGDVGPGSSSAVIEAAMTSAGLAQLEPWQRRKFLELLHQDGVEQAAFFAGNMHVANVHFRYERYQRSFVEMGPTGRILGSIMTHPRSMIERLYLDAGMLFSLRRPDGSFASLAERARAASRMLMTYAMYAITNSLLELLRGEDEEEKEKREVKSLPGYLLDPWRTGKTLLWTPGGVTVSLLNLIGEFTETLPRALQGEQAGLNRLGNVSARMARSFLPFYRQFSGAVKVVLGQAQRQGFDEAAVKRVAATIASFLTGKDTFEPAEEPVFTRTYIEGFQGVVFGQEAGLEGGELTSPILRLNTDESIRYLGNKANALMSASSEARRLDATPQKRQKEQDKVDRYARQIMRRVKKVYPGQKEVTIPMLRTFSEGVKRLRARERLLAPPAPPTELRESFTQEALDRVYGRER